ncbi:hypothetical protein [Sandaracinus amylolyticus]|uniref:Uncharacterized protein n=1 Tax=Sandaracinus amylolyticus TaxID=927083 RepID=A0A0F6VZD9_9BACT|nr:hypothetical protein [Sandaracinus amylolyticus]AKF03518.1 hypothetical protein DB32_000667 [Sandaracinus amylolyticus]
MAFRDDTDALRARIEILERELDAQRDVAEERDRLKARVSELEEQLGIAEERKRKELEVKAAEARESQRRRVEMLRHDRKAPSQIPKYLVIALGVGGAIFAFVRLTGIGCGPSHDAAPSLGLVDLDATPEPALPPLTTRGTTSTPDQCRGYVPDAPQLVLRSTRPTSLRIAPRAVSGDMVMLVVTPDGRVLCDDDGGGSLNPLISATVPPGDTRVWVGTYSHGESIDFTLAITARMTPEEAAASAGTPIVEGPDVTRAISGTVQPVTAASEQNASCRGYLPIAPQLTLRLARDAAVRLHASSQSDLVMLVREPDGTVKCDDDSGHGNEPQIATLLRAGDHPVWIGTYAESATPVPYSLDVSAHVIDRDAAPEHGTRELGAGEITIEGSAHEEVSPSAIGADCPGGLIGMRPHVALQLAEARDVVFALAGESAPFAVVEHPDRTFECVRAARARHLWSAGTHRVWIGVPDEATAGPFTLTLRGEASSVLPWAPR